MRIGRTLPPAASPIYIPDIINGIKGIFHGQKELERFNSELKDYYGVKHCFLVSSGKAALTLILKALHKLHPERDEVLIPAFICYSVPSAIARAGLKIRLCDVDPDTLDYNFVELGKILSEKSSNSRILAVIPAHLFGLPAAVGRVRKLAADSGVIIVEDAAQVLGSTWQDKKLGTLGDASFFSLGRGKALSTVEGGIIITNRDDIGENILNQQEDIPGYDILELVKLIFKALLLIVFQRPLFFWFPKSLPFLKVGDTFYDPDFKIRKMTGFQAGLAKDWKEKLEKFKNNRRENSMPLASITELSSIQGYCLKNGHFPDMLRFPVKIEDTGKWQKTLKLSEKAGLGIMFTYPGAVNGIKDLREAFQGQSFPIAEKLPRQLLTLPVHLYVSSEDKKKITNLIAQSNEDSPQRSQSPAARDASTRRLTQR